MTPTEVTTILRQFNEWRRGNENIPQLDAREIGKAIVAAIEMIERLEAAEKDIALKERVIDSLGSELNAVAKERDALRAKIKQMEQQEPVGVLHVGSYYGEELQQCKPTGPVPCGQCYNCGEMLSSVQRWCDGGV